MPFVQSGIFIFDTCTVVVGSSFIVGTSATQFPASAGKEHIVRLLQSGAVFVAGVAGMKSGQGLILTGDPNEAGASMTVKVTNLNLLYGIGMTSSVVTYLTLG